MMPSAERVLGIQSKPDFRRRERAMLRAGRAVLWIVIAAAVAGLFGDGLVSHAETTTPNGDIHLRFERITRAGVDTRLHLQFAAEAQAPTTFTLWIDRQAFERMQAVRITPQPVAMSLTKERVLLDIDEPASGGSRHILIEFQPAEAGVVPINLGLGDASELRVTQFVHF